LAAAVGKPYRVVLFKWIKMLDEFCNRVVLRPQSAVEDAFMELYYAYKQHKVQANNKEGGTA
jgi:hypothetical protein